MAENKRQHFIPQFYLRYFSLNKEDKQVCIYNLDREKYFEGNIKTICSKDYFYDKDGQLEKTLSLMEGAVSKTIGKIIESETIKFEGAEEFSRFLSFVCMQYGRTKLQGEINTQIANKIFDYYKPRISKEKGIDMETLKAMKMKHPHPVLHSLLYSLLSGVIISDMNMVLLKNNTSIEFITSDSPVIRFNPFFNKLKQNKQTGGFAQRGLILYFPLTPRFAIMFFDNSYYLLKKLKNTLININDKNEIRRLNGLQIIFCHENIYFANKNMVKDLELQIKQLKQKRIERGNTIKFEEIKAEVDGKLKEIVRFGSGYFQYNLDKLGFLKMKKDAIKEVGERNPERIRLFEKATDEINKEIKEKRKQMGLD